MTFAWGMMFALFGFLGPALQDPQPDTDRTPSGEQEERRPQDDEKLPHTHWSYELFWEFAKAGRIKSHPAFHFKGGRTFTRHGLAESTNDIIRAMNNDPSIVTKESREKILKLIEEFRPELRRMGGILTVPPVAPPPVGPAVPEGEPETPAIRFFGSDITTWSQTESKGNDTLTSLLDFNVETDFFHIEAVGTLDDRGPSGRRKGTGDSALGDHYFFDLSERYIVLFPPPESIEGLFIEAKVGDLRNTSYAQGLLLGAADPDGYQLVTRIGDVLRTHSLWGKEEDGTAIFGTRLEGILIQEVGTQLIIGAHAVDIDAKDPTRSGFAYGVDLQAKSRFLDVRTEFVNVEESGRGFFFNAVFHYFPNLRFEAEYRNYRDLLLDVNNAPIYSGISGGDDENDEAVRLGSVWSPWEFLTFTAKAERSENHDGSGRLLDAFIETRSTPWKGGDISVSFEWEEDRDAKAFNRLTTFDVSHNFEDGSAARFGYTRDDRDGEATDTFRGTGRVPLFVEELTFEYNHTLRLDGGEKEHIFQPRVLWAISDDLFFSVRYTHSDEGDIGDVLDLTLMIQW